MVYHTLALTHTLYTHLYTQGKPRASRIIDSVTTGVFLSFPQCSGCVSSSLSQNLCNLLLRTIKLILVLKSKYASYMNIFWRLFLQQIKFCSRCNTHRLQTVWAWNCRVTAMHQYSSEYDAHSLPTRWPCVCVCVSGCFCLCVYSEWKDRFCDEA